MGQEATARIVQPLYFCLKAKFSHMVSDSRKSTMWIYQWPQTSQIHFTYMSIYLCIHVYIDRAIVLKERGQSKKGRGHQRLATHHHLEPPWGVRSPSHLCRSYLHSLPRPAVHAACLFFGMNHNSCLGRTRLTRDPFTCHSAGLGATRDSKETQTRALWDSGEPVCLREHCNPGPVKET